MKRKTLVFNKNVTDIQMFCLLKGLFNEYMCEEREELFEDLHARIDTNEINTPEEVLDEFLHLLFTPYLNPGEEYDYDVAVIGDSAVLMVFWIEFN